MKKLSKVLIISLVVMSLFIACNNDVNVSTAATSNESKGEVYSINYDGVSNGRLYDKCEAGGKITEPEIPEKYGYNFAGWYKDPNYETPWDFNKDSVSGDMSLYAKWEPKEIVVTLSTDFLFTTTTVTYDTYYGDLPKAPSWIDKDGTRHNFIGWYDMKQMTGNYSWIENANGGWSEGYRFFTRNEHANRINYNTRVTIGEDHRLHGHWVAEGYSCIEFEVGNDFYIVNFPNGKTITPPESPEGYQIEGWYFLPYDYRSVEYESNEMFKWDFNKPVTHSMKLTAKLIPNRYTVTFDVDGKELSTKIVTFNDSYGKLPVPKKEGFKFLGWFDTTTGGNLLDASSIVKTGSDHTLYARFRELDTYSVFNIEFKANGGTGNMNSLTSLRNSDEISLPANKFTKDGYAFAGWNTEANGSGDYFDTLFVDKSDSIKNGETVTLYAQWYKPFTITAITGDSQVAFKFPEDDTKYSLIKDSFEYSLDGGITWKPYTLGSYISLTNAGDKISFRNSSNTPINFGSDFSGGFRIDTVGTGYFEYIKGTPLKEFSVSGNINSILDKHCSNNPNDVLFHSCYARLFEDSKITYAHDLELPATSLTDFCYFGLFYDNYFLKTPPKLPATKLAYYCYGDMFNSCNWLAYAPELPAMILAESCYEAMFANCWLKELPELPAKYLAKRCYALMFIGANISYKPALPDAVLARDCYYNMYKAIGYHYYSANNPDYRDKYDYYFGD